MNEMRNRMVDFEISFEMVIFSVDFAAMNSQMFQILKKKIKTQERHTVASSVTFEKIT